MAKKLQAVQLTPQATAQRLQLALPDTSKFGRLAKSLDDFGANVAGITVRKLNEASAEEEERGRVAGAKAIAEGRATEAELEKDGIITKGEGSFFRDGVMEMAGNAHADAFSNAVLIAAGEESLHESEDPEAMDKLIERISKKFNLEDRGEAFDAGFAGRAATLMSQHLSRHAMTVAGNLEKLNNDQLNDLLRGSALEGLEGADPNFKVENLVEVLVATGLKWRNNNTNEKPRDKRLLNKATTATIAGLVREGLINGDQAEQVMRRISGGTGSLWSMQKHANVVEEAINKFVSTESARNNFAANAILREQMTAGEDAIARMFAKKQEEGGLLDISEILAIRADNPGFFLDKFVEDTERMILIDENARQKRWVGDAVMFDNLRGRIISGQILNLSALVQHSVEPGKLNMDQVVVLSQLQVNHQNMLNNSPEKSARFRRADGLVQAGMKSWAGADFSQQQYIAALPAMAEAIQKWEDDPDNANLSAESPEFLRFATELVKTLQQNFMAQEQWRFMQETQLDLERDNKVAPYISTSYETDPDVLFSYYAETLLQQSDHRMPSPALQEFFSKSGREIPADAPIASYVQAIIGQLALIGINVTDEEPTAIVDALRLRLRPLADEEEDAAAEIVGVQPDATAVATPDKPSIFEPQTEGGPIPGLEEVFGSAFGIVKEAATGIIGRIPKTEPGKIRTLQQIARDLLEEDDEEQLGARLIRVQLN